MKGDFTRFTFDPTKLYSSVLLQQGRVLLDAEWNEQVDIEQHAARTTAADVIGLCGAPEAPGGTPANFEIAASGSAFTIAPGRIYVDGILVENLAAAPVSANAQPFLPANAPLIRDDAAAAGQPLPAAAGRYLAYLDVWQRHVTALEDGNLREVALGGPDSATRMQTVWQVFLQELAAGASCSNLGGGWPPAHAKTTGKLAARARPAVDPTNACQVPGGGGYSRLENQLYRVEVETSGELATAKFKWSRDNGMVVSAVTDGDTDTLTVDNPGRDSALAFAGDQYVELLNEDRELLNQPGLLLEVDDVKGDVLSFAPGSITLGNFPGRRWLRRWDGQGTIAEAADNDGFLKLENGVEIKFSAGYYRRGDYWLIPARTLKGDVLWPETLAGSVYVPDAMPPAGVEHHYCPLAIVDADLTGILTLVSDCRPLFPPLTKLTHFFYLSGDGQEALPGDPLPQPLEVGVANGGLPRAAARVRFQIFGTAGTATLTGEDGSSGTQITVTTDTNGIACCAWTLDADPAHRSQVVTAVLLNDSGSPVNLPPIQFNATANIALYYVGGDGQPVMPGRPAPQPLQVRVSHGDFRAVGRLVRFEDESGTGSLAADLAGLGAGAASFDATVNADGVAECAWLPSWPADPNVVSQRARARLLDPVGNPVLPPIHFTAHLSAARLVAYTPGCPDLQGAATVQEAIDQLCARPAAGVGGGSCITVGEGGMIPTLREALARVEAGDVPETCLCLLRGSHIVDDSIEVKGRGFIVTISGCGPNTQVILRGGRILFNGFAAVKIRDLEIQAYDLTDEAGLMFRECRSITISDCTLFAWESRNGLVRIGPGSQRILLGRDNIQMLEGQQFRFVLDALANTRARFLPEMMLEPNLNKYRLVLADTAEELADPQRFAERQEIAKIVETAARQRPDLGPGVIAQMLALSDTLLLRDVTPVGLMSAIDDLRKAAGHVGADVVVVVDDSSADLTIEDNDISGFVALYGTVDQELTRKVWTKEARSAAAAAIRGNTLTLAAGGGVLQLDNNRMTGLAVGRDMLKRLLEAPSPLVAAPKVTLTQIYRHAGLVNNVFFGHASTWLAQSVGLASNLFALNEPVPVDQAGAQTQALAGLSISRSATLTGNQGPERPFPGLLSVLAPRVGDVRSNVDLDISV